MVVHVKEKRSDFQVPLLGAIGRAIGSAIAAAVKNRQSSGGSSGGGSGGSSGKTTITGYSHKYEYDPQGNIYKDGRLIPKENYRYLPEDVVRRASSGTTTSTSGRTSVPGYSHSYEYDTQGNIYKDGRLIPKENYRYLPANVVSTASKASTGTVSSPDVFSLPPGGVEELARSLFEIFGGDYGQKQPMVPEYPVIPYQEELGSIIGELRDLVNQTYDPGSAALINKAYEDTIATIDAAQAQLVSQMQDQMSGVDEATLQSLKQIRDSFERNRQELMEEMSRRGLLQSGLWLEMEDRLNKGQLTAEQQLLASRLQDLQNQLNQALTNFGAMKISAAQQKGLSELEAMQSEAARRQQALQQGLATAIDLYNANRRYALDEFSATAPYYLETVTQAKDSARADAGLYGETPDYSSDPYYSQPGSPGSDIVSVREYVGNRGNVQWNKDDQTVTINGQKIEPAYIVGGKAYVNRATLDRILGGY